MLAIAGGALLLIGRHVPVLDLRPPRSSATSRCTCYPGGVQLFALFLALVAIAFLLMYRGPLHRLGDWFKSALAVRTLGLGSAVFMTIVLLLIAVQSGGLVNLDPGGWVSWVGSLLLAAGGQLMQVRAINDPIKAKLPGWVEILVIVILLALALFGSAFALGQEDGSVFAALLRRRSASPSAALVVTRVLHLARDPRRPATAESLMLGAFVVAFLFPFTQGGSDANMSIATQVIIFAATALGLNIVVGLAGLLDLGYVAFLGAGAYTAALLSDSAFATVGWKPPFLLVVLIGACRLGHLRPHHRHADPARLRRLPRHRHPRLR